MTRLEIRENDAETCVVNSYESSSVQFGSKSPETCITEKQKSKNKKKVIRQNHAMRNNDNDSDEAYIPKMKKRRSSKFLFLFYKYLLYKLL